ncbi:MAG: hypothetical protein EPO58_14100 [Chitinophagaceae bacterium]|nr:MAG: hypothetical protein EPO58_14100 [Chitinophagaceae bacterium]
MENINERVSINKLLSVFDVNNPNQNHFLVGWLAANGYLKTILTTNFDQNIEYSLQHFGLSKEKDFAVITELDNFHYIPGDPKIYVIKLHGSIDAIGTVLTTIRRIAQKQNKSRILTVLRQIFNDSLIDTILFAGYSFSDHFDITPALSDIQASEKLLTIIKYQHAETPDKIITRVDGLFKDFKEIKELYCDWDAVVASICKEFSIDAKQASQSADWEKTVRNWIYDLYDKDGYTDRNNCLGNLFLSAGFIELGRFYATSNINLAGAEKNMQFRKMDASAIMGKSYLKDPNNRNAAKAIFYYEEALKIAEVWNQVEYINIYKGSLASCYTMTGDHKKGEEMCRQIIGYYEPMLLDQVKRNTAIDRITGYKIMLAHSLTLQERFEEAINIYKDILPICDDEGLINNAELGTAGLGLAYARKGDFLNALATFRLGYHKAKTNGTVDRLLSLFFLVCSWSREVEGYRSGLVFFKGEIGLINQKTGFSKSYNDIPDKLIGEYKYWL